MAGELASLDPAAAAELTVAITEVIACSYEVEKRPVMTQAETQRRFGICLRWYRVLKQDCGFATSRIIDELPKALRHQLDGIPYAPPGGQSWSASRSKLYIPR